MISLADVHAREAERARRAGAWSRYMSADARAAFISGIHSLTTYAVGARTPISLPVDCRVALARDVDAVRVKRELIISDIAYTRHHRTSARLDTLAERAETPSMLARCHNVFFCCVRAFSLP